MSGVDSSATLGASLPAIDLMGIPLHAVTEKGAIDAILAGDRTAIIVLQSDHGVGSPGWNKRIHGKITRAEFLNRFGILSALRLPRACRDQIEQGKTAINTFPIVFGCLDGGAPKLLPNRSYLMNYAVDKVRVWRDD